MARVKRSRKRWWLRSLAGRQLPALLRSAPGFSWQMLPAGVGRGGSELVSEAHGLWLSPVTSLRSSPPALGTLLARPCQPPPPHGIECSAVKWWGIASLGLISFMFIFLPAQHLFQYLPKVRSYRVGAVKLALVQLLVKSEPSLPSSRLPERLRVRPVRCFRSLSNVLLVVMYRPGFWARLCSLVSLCAPLLRDAWSGGNFGPSLAGSISDSSRQCCHGQTEQLCHRAALVCPALCSAMGSASQAVRICLLAPARTSELFGHVLSSPHVQALGSRERRGGCLLGIPWYHGKQALLITSQNICSYSVVRRTQRLYSSGQALEAARRSLSLWGKKSNGTAGTFRGSLWLPGA